MCDGKKETKGQFGENERISVVLECTTVPVCVSCRRPHSLTQCNCQPRGKEKKGKRREGEAGSSHTLTQTLLQSLLEERKADPLPSVRPQSVCLQTQREATSHDDDGEGQQRKLKHASLHSLTLPESVHRGRKVSFSRLLRQAKGGKLAREHSGS